MSQRHDCEQGSYARRPERYRDVDADAWASWHWQQQNRVRELEELAQIVSLTDQEREAFDASADAFRVAVTPHYLALMDPDDPTCPIRRQALPHPGEMQPTPFELDDPLAEDSHMPVPGITHRYPDRVLFYVTHNCPMYCRHCTRKRKVADPRTAASKTQIDAGLAYIERTKAVRDVLVSGGDPLTLSNERLDAIIGRIRGIEHVEVIRLGTRNPVTLPQRIDAGLCDLLERHAPVYLHTHFNHPKELGSDATRALRRLLGSGCVLGNQMVLLAGVNDDPETVLELNRRLLEHGCRPYYMLQCDMARGITHFRTPLSRGRDIIEYLRGRIGGMGIPDFVVDLPGGGGKIELTPDYEVARRDSEYGPVVTFRNWAGDEFDFVDVAQSATDVPRGDADRVVENDLEA
jgi:lysine 2,3-aminomutase